MIAEKILPVVTKNNAEKSSESKPKKQICGP